MKHPSTIWKLLKLSSIVNKDYLTEKWRWVRTGITQGIFGWDACCIWTARKALGLLAWCSKRAKGGVVQGKCDHVPKEECDRNSQLALKA